MDLGNSGDNGEIGGAVAVNPHPCGLIKSWLPHLFLDFKRSPAHDVFKSQRLEFLETSTTTAPTLIHLNCESVNLISITWSQGTCSVPLRDDTSEGLSSGPEGDVGISGMFCGPKTVLRPL